MIKLIDGYVIDVDPLNYTLKKDTGKKDKKGNPIYRTFTYHGSVKQAIQACIDLIQRDKLSSDTFTLVEAINILNAAQNRFEQLLQKVIKEMEV